MGPRTELDATRLLPLTPEPPAWMAELLPSSSTTHLTGGSLETIESNSLVRVIVRLPQARELEASALAAGVKDAYIAIDTFLWKADRYPIRLWNFVPGIGERMGELDRYMVFNQGRYEALIRSRRLAGAAWSLPTSSALGIEQEDLVIECLASVAPGIPVENPRQISSWQYSTRFGPKPPCFARATIATIGTERWLLIGGTASIVGEDSLHSTQVEAQLAETLANLTAVIDEACGAGSDSLGRLSDLRVYITRPEDATALGPAVRSCVPRTARLEIALATICRPELLIEIEGRVRL